MNAAIQAGSHAATAEKIREILARDLEAEVEVVDESHKHAGHAGARQGGHFFVVIKSSRFVGLGLLARQRLVYSVLGDLLRTEIHALSMRCEELS